jgi:hypothetical protein
MPAWTSVGSTSAGSGEADLVRAAQPFLQDFFDNRDAEKSQARLLRRRWKDSLGQLGVVVKCHGAEQC